MRKSISRRNLIKLMGGSVAAAAGASLIPRFVNRKLLQPVEVAEAQSIMPNLYFAGTDGWISMPPGPAISFYFPDDLAPDNFNTYIFGFRNITGLDANQIGQQKMKAQHNAPVFWVDEYNGSNEFRLQLTNLGLQMRPRSHRLAHAALARFPQRDPLLRW
ncbi:MAG: hypothetical protein R2867_08035 [Caldilineaceae bacterium]